MMEGESEEARRFEEYWLAVGVTECGAAPVAGEIFSCASGTGDGVRRGGAASAS